MDAVGEVVASLRSPRVLCATKGEDGAAAPVRSERDLEVVALFPAAVALGFSVVGFGGVDGVLGRRGGGGGSISGWWRRDGGVGLNFGLLVGLDVGLGRGLDFGGGGRGAPCFARGGGGGTLPPDVAPAA